MKRTSATILTLLIAVSLLTVPALADESAPSTIPHVFYGQVYNVDGSNAPAGSIIVASVAGSPAGTTTVTTAGQYGVGPQDGDAEKFAVWNSTISPGDTITFSIYGVRALESAIYESGGFTNLTLTASAPPPTPTPSPTGGGGRGPSGGPVITPIPTPSVPAGPVGQASLPLSATGEVSESVTIWTSDGVGSLTVGEGTHARDASGNPLGEVTIARADAAGLPPIPPGAAIGFALNCGPVGATFDPPVTITYMLSEEEWERISDPATLSVMWYNPGTGEWQEVPATVDPATRTVTAQVSHFSLFALAWAAASPVEATTGPTGAAPGEIPSGPGSEQPAGGGTPWVLLAAGILVVAGGLAAGWYLLKKR